MTKGGANLISLSQKAAKKEATENNKKTNVLPKSVWDAKRGRFKDPKAEKPAFKKLDGPVIPRLSNYNRGRDD